MHIFIRNLEKRSGSVVDTRCLTRRRSIGLRSTARDTYGPRMAERDTVGDRAGHDKDPVTEYPDMVPA
jgi:hypothetical protein